MYVKVNVELKILEFNSTVSVVIVIAAPKVALAKLALVIVPDNVPLFTAPPVVVMRLVTVMVNPFKFNVPLLTVSRATVTLLASMGRLVALTIVI